MPLVCITPWREPHVPFDTPGLEVAASPVDSFGSAPAQFKDWLTTIPLFFHAATVGALAIGWSPTAKREAKRKTVKSDPGGKTFSFGERYPSRGRDQA